MEKVFSQSRIYQLVIVALTLLLVWKWNCGGTAPCPTVTTTTQTFVTSDTNVKKVTNSTLETKPTPVSIKTRPVYLPGTHTIDSFFKSVDTAAILSDYYAVRDYDTTYHFAEADITVQNYVSENKIQGQRLLSTFMIPEITNTVTTVTTVAEKKRGQVFLGVEGYGGPQSPLYGAGASIMYKTKRDKVYEIGPVIFKDQPVMYKVGAKFLLSFHK